MAVSESLSMWVRTATKRDFPAIKELLVATWHATYDDIYGVERVNQITGEWHSLAALEKQLAAPKSEFLVADDGKKIAGMAYARQTSDQEVKLHQLCIFPDFQGRGVGAMLLEEIEESFFEVPKIILEVEEKNTQAVSFYSKHGFLQSGTVENCGAADSGIAALTMEKTR
jgi:ribosomal protein S18 acetylase RimI-like enzyme